MLIPGRTMLVAFGIFIGIIFFGANVITTNFNQIVAPDKPLVLMNWRVEQEEMKITLMGETYKFPFKDKYIKEAWNDARAELENKIEIMQQVVYEIKGGF